MSVVARVRANTHTFDIKLASFETFIYIYPEIILLPFIWYFAYFIIVYDAPDLITPKGWTPTG